MSTHLRTGMHDAIDGGTDASPFTSDDLLGRIRRRRAVRTGSRAVVGVGAAGVVAFGATTATRPDEAPAQPAGNPTGGLGGCGLDVRTYAADHRDTSVTLVGQGDPVAAMDAFAADGAQHVGVGLGRFGGRLLELFAISAGDDTPDAMRLLLASDGVVVGWAQTNSGEGGYVSWTVPLRQSTLAAGDVGGAGVSLATTIESCDGGAMPAGVYDVYAAPGVFYPDQPLLDVAGPWLVELLPEVADVSSLPAGFPAADVPMPGGSVEVAKREPDGGWTVEVAVDGDDRLARATRLLPPDGDADPATLDVDSVAERTSVGGAWRVRVAASHSADGRDTLVYRLTPA